MNKDILIRNIDKLHTTVLGKERIKNNLMIKTNDIIEYCKNIIVNENKKKNKKGKNYYCETNKEIITINSYNYSIITAHKKGKN